MFAAQAPIALQNAETHHEVALRAETDALTGLRNHGTFQDILPFTDADGARAVAGKVADTVRAAGRRRSGPAVSASIGIATYPVDGRTREDLLLAADRACYAAKRGGRDRVATAQEGLSLAEEFLATAPTPVDEGHPSS